MLEFPPSPPPGLVHLMDVSHTELSSQLNSWKTALPGTPRPDRKTPIYVSPEELQDWKSQQCDSTR